MSEKEFINYISKLGFKLVTNNEFRYFFKKYEIFIYSIDYSLYYNGPKLIGRYPLNNLTPFKQIERSYKLKKILG